jgi:hypothetical protein
VSGEAGVTLAAPRGGRTIPDLVLGALGVGMMMLALVVLIQGGEEDAGSRPLPAPPAVALLEPAPGAAVGGPLSIVFRVEGELVQQPAGWGIGGFHLHLRLDDLELMPSRSDVEALRAGSYRWTVGRLEPGSHRLRLFWSDSGHQPVAGGESELVEIVVP